MSTVATYGVTGMTCEHCVNAVTAELQSLPGVSVVEVDLAAGSARVTSAEPLADDAVRDAIDEAGYTLAGTVR